MLGWAGHAVADFLTHVDDARPLFWPLLDRRWSRPVSYYNTLYYGREFLLVEHASMLAIMAGLLVRRLRGRERGRENREAEKDPVAGAQRKI